MSRKASKEDFELGGLYTEYREFPFFSERADFVVSQFPQSSVVVIVGCGYGYLVQKLRDRGVEAWGVEISDYAIHKAKVLLPDISPFILKGDCTSKEDMDKILFHIKQEWVDLVISEDVLPVCNSLEEVERMLSILRTMSDTLLHIVSYISRDTRRKECEPSLLWFDLLEWKSIVAPDFLYDREKKRLV